MRARFFASHVLIITFVISLFLIGITLFRDFSNALITYYQEFPDMVLYLGTALLSLTMILSVFLYLKSKKRFLKVSMQPHFLEVDKNIVKSVVVNFLEKKFKEVKVDVFVKDKVEVLAYIPKIDSIALQDTQIEVERVLSDLFSYRKELQLTLVNRSGSV